MQFRREFGFTADGFGLPPFLGQVIPDADPEVPVGRLVPHHGIIGHGHPGHFDDAGLYGVDQRKIRHHPGEQGAFRETGAPQKEGGGGEIIDHFDTQLGPHRFQTGNPDAGRFFPFLRFFTFIAGELLFDAVGFAAVAVVGFVIDNDDILFSAQLPADPAHHLLRGFGERAGLPCRQDSLGQACPRPPFPAG